MAQVPGRAITPQVDVGAAPSGRFEAPQFVNYEAQNAIQAGQGLQQLGGSLGQIAADMAQQANAARLDDAMNQYLNAEMDLKHNQQTGYLNLKGEAALKRPNGISLDQEYTDQLKTKVDAIYDGLGNQAQKDAFRHVAGAKLIQFRSGVMDYMTQQDGVYRKSVAQATQATASNQIALSWGDPKATEDAAERIRSAAYQEAMLSGKSEEEANLKALESTSKGHILALASAIDRGDYIGAKAYLSKYSKQMEPNDIFKATNAINKQYSETMVGDAVTKTYSTYNSAFGSNLNRALTILWDSESNSRHFDKSGNITTSPKGAIGISQIMPDVGPEAAKIAGVPWKPELFFQKMTGDPVKDKEAIDYNRTLGAAFFGKQVQDFVDIDKAYAAYNAGPGAVKEAIKKAEKEGGSYLNYLPKETQNYVNKNMGSYNAGNGEFVVTKKQIDDQVLSNLGPYANDEMRKKALAQSDQQYEKLQKDPVLYALRNPSFGVNSLSNFANTQSVAQELGNRYQVMGQVSKAYGTKFEILSDQESEAFSKYMDGLLPQDKARVLGELADKSGVSAIQAISTQLHDKNSTLAIAAMLSSFKTTKDNNSAALYLQGREAIDQKRAAIDQKAETGIKAQIYDQIKGVYQTPKGMNAAAEAAYGIYAKLKSNGDDNVDRAVRLATGGIMDFNGAKIAKPYGWDDSTFRDTINNVAPSLIKESGGDFIVGDKKIKASDFAKSISGSRLQTYGQGTYLVMAGNDVVRTSNGSPYVLKVTK